MPTTGGKKLRATLGFNEAGILHPGMRGYGSGLMGGGIMLQ